MRRIGSPVGIVILVSTMGWGPNVHAQPGIPSERIPQGTPLEIRKGIEQLYSSAPEERVRAIGKLSGEGERAIPAVPFLIAMFSDDAVLYDDEQLARRALISSYASPFSFPNSPGESAARAIGRLAAKMQEPPIDDLLLAMKDRNQHARANAIRALGEIGHLDAPNVVAPLAAALNDKSPKIRAYAARTLGRKELARFATEDPVVENLISRLHDEDSTVRADVAWALRYGKGARVVGPLVVVLEDPSETLEVRQNAAEALGRIGDRAAVEPLVEALRDQQWQVRQAALSVVALIDEPRVLRPLLVSALQDKEWRVRARAAGATARLSKLKDPGAWDLMTAVLKDSHPNVRARATEACAESKDYRTVMPLCTVLRKDPNSYVAWHAANALGALGDPRAVGPLTEALGDENELVRSSSQRALKRIETIQNLSRRP